MEYWGAELDIEFIESVKIFSLSASELVNEFINSLIFLYRLVEVKIFIA